MQEQILHRAIELYGEEMQIDIAIEEMAELIKELIKHKRGANNRNAVVEELADVVIMVAQLGMIFEVDEKELDKRLDFKINRLRKRMDNVQ